jgi:hypothetical protein
MVTAMFARPEEHRVLKRRSAKDQRKQSHQPMRLKCPMREKTVVPDGDREPTGKKHYEKEDDLEGVQPEKPEINGYCGNG